MSKILAALDNTSSSTDSLKWLVDWVGGRKTTSGVRVNPTNSMTVSAYYACLRNVSEDIGKLPFRVFRKLPDGGETVDTTNFVNKLLFVEPNPDMTPMSFKETMNHHAMSYGNGYAEIVRNGVGIPTALFPIHPQRVKVVKNGRDEISYEVLETNEFDMGRTKGDVVMIPSQNMLHIKGLGGDGLVGYSVVKFAAENLGTAIATQQFSGAFFGNSASLSGMLEHPSTLSKEAQERLVKSWEERHKGSKNAHKIGVLEEGLKWHQTGVPPKDAQFIEVREFQISDIARWFRMPPHKIQDLKRATFSNIEAQNIEYVNDTLMPWIKRWEEEVKRKLLTTRTNFARFSVQALLRGDSKARSDYYRNQLNIGALSINEIRAFEELNPIGDSGDKYFMQLNMTTVDRIVEGEKPETTEVIETEEEMDNNSTNAEDLRPIVSAIVKRVNDKERNATSRAIKRAEAGRCDIVEWFNKFASEQTEYFIESLKPVLQTLSLNGDTEIVLQQILMQFYENRISENNILSEIDDNEITGELMDLLNTKVMT